MWLKGNAPLSLPIPIFRNKGLCFRSVQPKNMSRITYPRTQRRLALEIWSARCCPGLRRHRGTRLGVWRIFKGFRTSDRKDHQTHTRLRSDIGDRIADLQAH